MHPVAFLVGNSVCCASDISNVHKYLMSVGGSSKTNAEMSEGIVWRVQWDGVGRGRGGGEGRGVCFIASSPIEQN